MATIKNEFDYIQEARERLAKALISKFGVREQDILNADGSINSAGLWASNSDGSKNQLKRLHDWEALVTATNVHTDASLTFKDDGHGDGPNTTFNGSVARSISYNSIGAAPAVAGGYLPLAGGTMTGQIKGDTGGTWIAGKDNALIYQYHNAPGAWSPVIGFQTRGGNWEFGSNGNDYDNAVFSWMSDQGTNDPILVTLRKTAGTIALTSEIPTVTNYYWANMNISDAIDTTTSPIFGSVVSTGLITANSGIQIGSTPMLGWFSQDSRICASGVGGGVGGVNIGSLLVSDTWTDYPKVPTNGIYSKGNIITPANVRALNLNLHGAFKTDFGIHFNQGDDTQYGFSLLYRGGNNVFELSTRNASETSTILTISRGTTKVYFKGSIDAKDAIYTEKYLSFGYHGVEFTSDISNSWRTSIYGDATPGSRLITVRAGEHAAIDNFSEPYCSGLAWATGDTHGYLGVSYNSGNAWIGGGNADELLWSTYLVTGNNIGLQSVNYAASAGNAESLGGLPASDYLPLSGGTMTGPIITPGDDSVVIKPARNNYDLIGNKDAQFWGIYSHYFYGNLQGNATNATKFNNTTKDYFVYANGVLGTSNTEGTSRSLNRTQFWRDNTRGRIGVFVSHSETSTYGWEISASYSNDGDFTGRIKAENSWGNEYTFITDSNWRQFIAINSSASREFWINGIDAAEASTSCPALVMHWPNRIYADIQLDTEGFKFKKHDPTYSTNEEDIVWVNLTANAYYAASDIRYKNVIKHSCIDLSSLATLPLFLYTWNNKQDDIIHIGSSAQAVEQVIPELVTEDSTGFKSLNYSVLGTIAGITACKELVSQKSEIEMLKDRVKQLEQQLKMYNG